MLVRFRTDTNTKQCRDEVYINPVHVAVAHKELRGPNAYHYTIETIGGMLWIIDEDGYNRIVDWIKVHAD